MHEAMNTHHTCAHRHTTHVHAHTHPHYTSPLINESVHLVRAARVVRHLPSPEGPSHLQEARLSLIGGQSLQVVSEQCPLQVADGHVTDVDHSTYEPYPERREFEQRGRRKEKGEGKVGRGRLIASTNTTNHSIYSYISTCLNTHTRTHTHTNTSAWQSSSVVNLHNATTEGTRALHLRETDGNA